MVELLVELTEVSGRRIYEYGDRIKKYKSNLACYFRGKIVLKINKKLSIPQILFTAFFVATLITVSDSFIEWDKPIYHGIYAGVLFIVGVVIAKVIFKDK